ncbi:MAG: cobalt ABC transporter ATPase [Peptococcaceae bacterium BRH_c8a]|nr:MAG: cobalt ABC transporter ATPase [Peptococcaceae bacterium BRH_c8a]
MVTPVIETRELTYTYPDGTRALRGINIKLTAGQKIAVLGSNGAGKSTLFLHLNGILRPQGGKVLFRGSEIRYHQRDLLALRKNVGIVFQDPESQLFSASVLQDVTFGPINLGLPQNEALTAAKEAMRQTGITNLESRPTHFLSYGQKKRVSIAGVLAMEPAVIIFDEPTACLDPGMALKTMALLDELSRQGKAIIMSTHDVDRAYDWADYVYLLQDGGVIGEGEPQHVFLRQDWLDRCDLKCPIVVETYLELTASGLLPVNMPVPRNKQELFQNIRNASPASAPLLKTVRHG